MNEHIIVALVATKGLEDFLRNSLTGLTRVGVNLRIVHVARPDNAADSIDPIVAGAGAMAHSFAEFGQPSPAAMPERYVDYGTEPFIAVNWRRSCYIRWLLDRYRHVVYADLDVGWLGDPCGISTRARIPDRGAAEISAGAVLGISVREII